MIKFILVIKICYAVAQFCAPGLESNIKYDSFRDCAIDGYLKAHELIVSMPPPQVEETQTLIKFYCLKEEPKIAPKGTTI